MPSRDNYQPSTGAGRYSLWAKSKEKSAVKVQPKKAKTAQAAKPVKKPAPKAAAKPLAKPVTKPVGKAKPTVKGKPAAKVVAKAVVKAKPVAKGRVAVATKAAGKPKPVVKNKVLTKAVPAKKVLTKVVQKAKAKAPAKPVPKKATQGPVKAASKVIGKVVGKPAAKPVAKVAGKAVAKPAEKRPAKVVAKAPAPVPVPAAPVAALPLPPGTVVQKGGRPSARLQQITVPSMAQSVASTAAKASFTKDLPPLFTPPPMVAPKKDPKLANNWKSKPAEHLTDAELLAMPDSEYMNDKQMAAFRLKLVQLKNGILSSASETTEHLRDDTVVVPDPADRATIEEEHALELRTRDRERKLLKKIEQSINRIDAGDYGYCDETGEVIGVGRLIARPTATLTLEAQQRRELKQKMFGD